MAASLEGASGKLSFGIAMIGITVVDVGDRE